MKDGVKFSILFVLKCAKKVFVLFFNASDRLTNTSDGFLLSSSETEMLGSLEEFSDGIWELKCFEVVDSDCSNCHTDGDGGKVVECFQSSITT